MSYFRQPDTCSTCPTPMPRRANGRRPRCNRCSRKHKLRVHYGMTLEDYDSMLEAQGKVCKICKQPETRVIRGIVPSLSVDHDHSTGRIRGLLCYACNHMIGLAKDNVGILEEAIAYLVRTGSATPTKK